MLAFVAEPRAFAEGRLILKEGDAAHEMFVVREGSVSIRRRRARPETRTASASRRRSREHRPHPCRGGGGDRGAAPIAGARSAILEEPRAAPAGAR
jgi:hypothetical protein